MQLGFKLILHEINKDIKLSWKIIKFQINTVFICHQQWLDFTIFKYRQGITLYIPIEVLHVCKTF